MYFVVFYNYFFTVFRFLRVFFGQSLYLRKLINTFPPDKMLDCCCLLIHLTNKHKQNIFALIKLNTTKTDGILNGETGQIRTVITSRFPVRFWA